MNVKRVAVPITLGALLLPRPRAVCSGAICRIAFSSRANRHYRKCTPIGFAKHP